MATYIYNGGVLQPTYSEDGNRITGLTNPDGTPNYFSPLIKTSQDIPIPTGFRLSTIPFKIKRLFDSITWDFDITSRIPTVTVTYFVDPINGLDSNSGLTRMLALKTINAALQKADVDQIRIINLTQDYIALVTEANFNTRMNAFGRSLSIISENFNYIATCSPGLRTWTRNATFSNVYQNATAATQNPVDFTNTSFVSYINNRGQVITPFKNKMYGTLSRVASIALVSTTPNSFFHDGTNIYVRTFDDRDLTVSNVGLYVMNNANNGRLTVTANNLSFYFENIDYVGGSRAFLSETSNVTAENVNVAFSKCSFQASGTGNGLNILHGGTVFVDRCGFYNNWNDGANYHSFGSSLLNPSPSVYEFQCSAKGNGTTGTGGTTHNASTAHEAVSIIRIGGHYIDSKDRVVADIQDSHAWMLDCYVGQPLVMNTGIAALTSESVSPQAARLWVDNVQVAEGASPQLQTDTTAIIRTFATPYLTSAGGGTIETYLP